jgi:hypothetical protein
LAKAFAERGIEDGVQVNKNPIYSISFGREFRW